MRKKGFVISCMAVALLFTLGSGIFAQADKPEQKKEPAAPAKAETGKSWFMVTSPHTAEECMACLDAVNKESASTLAQYDWGCMSGDHTGYIKVQAVNVDEALKTVPELVRAKAKAVKLNKFTEADLRKAHEAQQ